MKKKNFLRILFLLVFLFAGYKIVTQVKGNKDFERSQAEVQEVKRAWEVKKEASSIEDGESSQAMEIEEFQDLKATMPSMVAWLTIPGTDIDFPVVQGKDNDYYLNHDYQGNYNPLGAVFLEMENTPDFQDQNSILYGHNVKSGKVFNTLLNYLDPEFVHQAPVIELLTAQGKRVYEIRGVYRADPYDNFRSPYYEGEAWDAFTSRWKTKNLLEQDAPSSDDTLLTLQTCLDSGERLVIHGVWTS